MKYCCHLKIGAACVCCAGREEYPWIEDTGNSTYRNSVTRIPRNLAKPHFLVNIKYSSEDIHCDQVEITSPTLRKRYEPIQYLGKLPNNHYFSWKEIGKNTIYCSHRKIGASISLECQVRRIPMDRRCWGIGIPKFGHEKSEKWNKACELLPKFTNWIPFRSPDLEIIQNQLEQGQKYIFSTICSTMPSAHNLCWSHCVTKNSTTGSCSNFTFEIITIRFRVHSCWIAYHPLHMGTWNSSKDHTQ